MNYGRRNLITCPCLKRPTIYSVVLFWVVKIIIFINRSFGLYNYHNSFIWDNYRWIIVLPLDFVALLSVFSFWYSIWVPIYCIFNYERDEESIGFYIMCFWFCVYFRVDFHHDFKRTDFPHRPLLNSMAGCHTLPES